jgi:hypothetical protein
MKLVMISERPGYNEYVSSISLQHVSYLKGSSYNYSPSGSEYPEDPQQFLFDDLGMT